LRWIGRTICKDWKCRDERLADPRDDKGRRYEDILDASQQEILVHARWIDHLIVAATVAPSNHRMWRSDHVMIWIVLDAEGRVESCDSLPVRRDPEGLLDTLRRWFGR